MMRTLDGKIREAILRGEMQPFLLPKGETMRESQAGLMRELKVNKSDLLAKVIQNRERHIKSYKEACEGYRELALERIDEVTSDLKAQIDGLRKGEMIEVMTIHFGLDVPRSYESEYDQVIEMLKMSVDDIITLDSREFACFVMDDWDWKDQFQATTMNYSPQMVRAAKLRKQR